MSILRTLMLSFVVLAAGCSSAATLPKEVPSLASTTTTQSTTATSTITVKGTLVSADIYKFTIKTASCSTNVSAYYSKSTTKFYPYLGYPLTVGMAISVTGTGSCSAGIQATTVVYNNAPTPAPSVKPSPTSSPTTVPSPTPVASSSPTVPSSTPSASPTAQPSVAPPSSSPTPRPTNTPIATPSATNAANGPTQVLTIIYGWGGAAPVSSAVPLTQQARFTKWAYTNPTYNAKYQAVGIKTIAYRNFWRNYKIGGDLAKNYPDLAPGGAHAGAEAKGCDGTPSYDSSYNGVYLSDPRNTAEAIGHANVVMGDLSAFNAVFADDSAAAGGAIPTPCNFSPSTWVSATANVLSQLPYQFFANALGAYNPGSTPTIQAGVAAASNVLGAMCEACYVNNAGAVRTSLWIGEENGEANMVTRHRIYYEYARSTAAAKSSQTLRMFAYASFLLTYDVNYAMYADAFYTPYAFTVMPETQFVPMKPLQTYTSVAGYLHGSVYTRQYGNCYYQGKRIGSCEIVVNPSTATAAIPMNSYTHSMSLVGGGLCDALNSGVCSGGYAGFSSAKPSSLAPSTAAILIGP